jgi:hypothetical protein
VLVVLRENIIPPIAETADWHATVACVPIVVDISTGSGQSAEAMEVSRFTGRNLVDGGFLGFALSIRSAGNPKFYDPKLHAAWKRYR